MPRKSAAFYDMDGTLVAGNVVDHYLYYAKTDPDLQSRARRLAGLAIKGPFFWAMDRIDRRAFNDLFYRSYAGLSEDRLVVLGEELFETVLKERIFPAARDLVDGDRANGRELVLLTGAIDAVARPVARHLGIPTVVATKLEFGRNGLATGVLLPPVMAGPEKSVFVRRFAEANDIDLEQSVAYADDAADLPLLSVVGRPIAVNPDVRLTATARSHRWPIVRLDARVPLAEKAASKAKEALSVAQDFAQRAIAEGEARWKDRDELVERAKRLVGQVGTIAEKARDAAKERLQQVKKEASREKKEGEAGP